MNTVDIDGIDMPEALARLAGNYKLLVRVVGELINMFEQQSADFSNSIQAEKFDEIYARAHSFKGIAASIVARDVYEATREIEHACEQKSVTLCEAGFQNLAQAIRTLKGSLPA